MSHRSPNVLEQKERETDMALTKQAREAEVTGMVPEIIKDIRGWQSWVAETPEGVIERCLTQGDDSPLYIVVLFDISTADEQAAILRNLSSRTVARCFD